MILLYPGSFDPLTLGHMNIIDRAARLAEKLIIAVSDNPHKTPLFSVAERVSLIQGELQGIHNIEVASFSGLLAEYARQCNVTTIIRGVRDGEDFINESRYAWHNRLFDQGVETLLLPSNPSFSPVSSRIVREAAALIYQAGLDDSALRQLVSDRVCTALKGKFIIKPHNGG
jgi:pantetheine-phosphate adenylyltransferase